MNAPTIVEGDSHPLAAKDDEPRCPNCREPLLGAFCYGCGQPKKGFIRHLSGIIGDFLDTVFNIDSRTLRTVLPLFFRPGFLSVEYFEGRRVRYVTPLRMYFFFSVFAFLAVSWVTHVEKSKNGDDSWFQSDDESAELEVEEIEQQRREAIAALEQTRSLIGDAAFKNANAAVNKRVDSMLRSARSDNLKNAEQPKKPLRLQTAPPAPGPAGRLVPDPPVLDALDDPNPMRIQFGSDGPWDPVKQPVQIGWLNAASNAWLTAQAARIVQNAKLVKDDPNRFLAQVFRLAPQTLFVLLPLFALMLKCFYLFKRRLYMEHLIVALHSHSFLCLSILLLAGSTALSNQLAEASWWKDILGFIDTLIFWWIPIYLLIAQKRIYRQGWPMTVLKYAMIGFAYSFLIIIGIFVNMMLSLASL